MARKRLELEDDASLFQLEDGAGNLLLQTGPDATIAADALAGGFPSVDLVSGTAESGGSFCLALEDGTSHLLLEDGASCLLWSLTATADAIASAIARVQLKVNLSVEPVVATVVASVVVPAKAFLAFAVLAGGLPAQQSKVNLSKSITGAGIPYVARRLFFDATATCFGLPDALRAAAGALVEVTAAAVAAGLGSVSRLAKRAFSTRAFGIAAAVVQALPRISFSGGMGLGSVGRVGGGWRSWKQKSRR